MATTTMKHSRLNSVTGTTNLLLNLFFSAFSLACVLPLVLVVMISITDEQTLALNSYSFFPQKISLYAYQYMFGLQGKIGRAYGVTVFVTVVGTLLCLLFTSMYAYPLSRKDFRYRKACTFYMFFTMLFNGGLVAFYIVYVKLGLKNNICVLIAPALVSAYNILIMRTFFANTIPESVLESAKIDGAGELRIFFQIVIPLSLPVFATIGLFSSLGYWNDWFTSLLFITNDKIVSLQYLMYKVQATIQYLSANQEAARQAGASIRELPQESARFAMCIIGIGPIVLAYPFFQRYFVKGLTIGAVKG